MPDGQTDLDSASLRFASQVTLSYIKLKVKTSQQVLKCWFCGEEHILLFQSSIPSAHFRWLTATDTDT